MQKGCPQQVGIRTAASLASILAFLAAFVLPPADTASAGFGYSIRTRDGILSLSCLETGGAEVPVGTKGQRRVPSAGFPSSTDTPFWRCPQHSRVGMSARGFRRAKSVDDSGRTLMKNTNPAPTAGGAGAKAETVLKRVR